MSFSMTPVSAFPPTTRDAPPTFIQFQVNGVNLGGPDADTINFVGPAFEAMRGGSGIDDDTVTIYLE